jgi:hypothetical protein
MVAIVKCRYRTVWLPLTIVFFFNRIFCFFPVSDFYWDCISRLYCTEIVRYRYGEQTLIMTDNNGNFQFIEKYPCYPTSLKFFGYFFGLKPELVLS